MNLDLLLLATLILLVISIIVIFVRGKRSVNAKKWKAMFFKIFPITIIVTTLITVFFIDFYYQRELENELEKYKTIMLQNEFSNASMDSIPSSKVERDRKLDSLRDLNKELNDLLNKIEKQEKILGEKENIKSTVKNQIKTTSLDISKIESYNEISEERESFENMEGYTTSGNTSNFEFFCPTDSESDFIDLVIKFNDPKLIDKIAFIYVDVVEIVDDKTLTHVFDQTYVPKKGLNAFRIKNYLKKPNRRLSIGYFLKSEIKEKYPVYEKINCYSY